MEQKDGGWLEIKDDGWGLEGLASTWDTDLVGDQILRGAFADSLRERPRVPLLWAHDQTQPIGVAQELRETAAGLWGKWKISRTAKGQEARTLLLDQALDGLSIGFTAGRGDFEHREGVRYLKRLQLHEVSLVCLPANLGARVTAVKEQGAARESLVRPYAERLLERTRREHYALRLDGLSAIGRQAEVIRLRVRLRALTAR